MEDVRNKLSDILSWAGAIDDASVSDRWSLAVLCAARELESMAMRTSLYPSTASTSAAIMNFITAESLDQLFILGNVFEVPYDQFSTKDRLSLCAIRVAVAAVSDAAALRMADELVHRFILARDDVYAGQENTGHLILNVRELRLSVQDRAVLLMYMHRIVECVAVLPLCTSKAALDEIFGSWFTEMNRLIDAEEVDTEMFKLKLDFLQNLVRNVDATTSTSLSQYFDDSLDIFIDWSSKLVLRRTGIARDYVLKGIFIPLAAAPIRRHRGGESCQRVVATLRSLSTALARDLTSISGLWCAILNEGFGSRNLLELVFSDATVWETVVRCFLSSDAIVRKRACFITELFVQHWSCEQPAQEAVCSIHRLWLEDFVDAYRQVEGCSYLHLVYQIWGHLERLCSLIDPSAEPAGSGAVRRGGSGSEAGSDAPSACPAASSSSSSLPSYSSGFAPPSPSFLWLRALLECLLNSNVVAIRKHTMFMILTERLRLPLIPEAISWVSGHLLLAMDASTYFPIAFEDVSINEGAVSKLTAQLSSIVSGSAGGAASKGLQSVLKDPLLEHPGVLLPTFIHRMFSRCCSTNPGLVVEFVLALVKSICARKNESGTDTLRSSESISGTMDAVRVKSLTAVKWTLLAFARADLQRSLSSFRCLAVSELQNIKSFINDRLSSANSTVSRQVLLGLRPLLVSCSHPESVGPSRMFRSTTPGEGVSLVDVLLVTGWADSVANCYDSLREATSLWAECLDFNWSRPDFEKDSGLLDSRDSFNFSLLGPFLDLAEFPDLAAVHHYFVTISTNAYNQPYTQQHLQQLAAMHAAGILISTQISRIDNEVLGPFAAPFVNIAVDFASYVSHSIKSVFYSELQSDSQPIEIRWGSNIQIQSSAQLETVCSLSMLPVAAMGRASLGRGDNWWSPTACETARKVIEAAMCDTLSFILLYMKSSNGSTTIPILRSVHAIVASFLENVVKVLPMPIVRRITSNAVVGSTISVCDAMCGLRLCTSDQLRSAVDGCCSSDKLSTLQRVSTDEWSHFGKYTSTCNELRWAILKDSVWGYYRIGIHASDMNPGNILTFLLDMIHSSPSQSLPNIAVCLSVAAGALVESDVAALGHPRPQSVDAITSCLDVYWRTCLSEEVLECTQVFAFIDFAFSKALMQYTDLFGIKKYFDIIVSLGLQGKPHLIQFLVFRLVRQWMASPALAQPFMLSMRRLLIYREPPLDDYNAVEIKQSGENGTMDRRYFPVTRLMILHFFESLNNTADATPEYSDIWGDVLQLMTDLVIMNLEPAYAKQAVIGSEAFGEKLRSWQALCVLSKFASKSWVESAIPACLESLRQNCGHAIRVHMEFFIALLMSRFPSLIVPLIIGELKHFSHSQQTVSSLFVILGHACESTPFLSSAESKASGVALSLSVALLPWMTCAPGLSRSIAQLIAYRAIPIAKISVDEDVIDDGSENKVIPQLMAIWNFLSVNKDASKMRTRQEEFFKDYNLFSKSSLAGLVSVRPYDGFCPRSSATAISCSDYLHPHLLNVLADFIREDAADEAKAGVECIYNESAETGAEGKSSAMTLQTKRIPVDELQLTLLEEAGRLRKNGAGRDRQDTIVCASLVGKATNLGGLARTCEIFAANKLIVSSLSILGNEVFQNIAVSSAPWLPIEEVPISDLAQYLRRCRSAGYTIVGLEQTDSSVSLSGFQSPSRCVLLLGREREGIPAELLQEVDVCVEIPQFGVTRSLNVHVSASIALWEITKQNKAFMSKSLSQNS